MPELPEVEHLRRSLEPVVVGARFISVSVRRRSVVACGSTALPAALLVGTTIIATHRRGKQMAIESSSRGILVVQLGMTGSMTIERDTPPRGMDAKHRHVIWEIEPAGQPAGTRWKLAFRDPRRFGGLTAYASLGALGDAWDKLGPDALDIKTVHLAAALARTGRPIKSALLDQSVLAGVGNIYADESLFAARIHPLRPASTLDRGEVASLASHLRRILWQAANRGGSTLRDYRDAFGQPGSAVQIHQAYGREGEPCMRCRTPLEGLRLQGRATVFCPRCQDLSTDARPLSAQRTDLTPARLRKAKGESI